MMLLTSSFIALVSNAFLLPTIMFYFERTLMVFLLLQNCVENHREYVVFAE